MLDARLPDGSGIDVCRDIRSVDARSRCLILTSYDDDDALFAAVMAGASGYLLKEIRGTTWSTRSGRSPRASRCSTRRVTARVMDRLRDGRRPTTGAGRADRAASARSSSLIADGLTNRQIGERMFLAEKTVKNYVSSLLAKLGMERRTQAAVFGAEIDKD